MELAWLAVALGLALAVAAIAAATVELSRRVDALQRSIVALRDLRPGIDAVRGELGRLEQDLSRTARHPAIGVEGVGLDRRPSIGSGR